LAAVLLAVLAIGPAGAAEPLLDWLYPGTGTAANPPGGWDGVAPLPVPGSSSAFTEAEIRSRSRVIDWFPRSHDPLPDFMADSGDPRIYACAKCHMPNGNGRLENAPVSGLPARYILDQVREIAEGRRRFPEGTRPPNQMIPSAEHLSSAQLAAAADYFSRLVYAKRVDVEETDRVPATEPFAFVLRVTDGPAEPLGERIIEVYADFERFERRDPNVRTRAFVPKGSVAAGRLFATTGGGDPAKICSSCHGPDLRGGADWPGPPLAGRFPTYLLRQLFSFQNGLRQGEGAAPMRSVTTGLTTADMIALAAYAASLDP